MITRFGKTSNLDRRLYLLGNMKKFSVFEDKEVILKTNFQEKSFHMLKEMNEKNNEIISNLERISSSLETFIGKYEKLEDYISKLESSNKSVAQESSELSTQIDVIDKNLHQVRLLTERIADKINDLSKDSIDRYVREPIIKEIGRIYNIIREMQSKDDKSRTELLENLRQIMETQEMVVIEPKRRAIFNPTEHQPIKSIKTQLTHLDKHIFKTYRAGIKFKERVIQPAMVGVFSLKEDHVNQNKEETKNASNKE